MPCVTCGRAFASRTLPNATFFSLCCLLDMKYSSRSLSCCPMSTCHVPPCHYHLCRVRHLAQCCSLRLSTCFVHLWVSVNRSLLSLSSPSNIRTLSSCLMAEPEVAQGSALPSVEGAGTCVPGQGSPGASSVAPGPASANAATALSHEQMMVPLPPFRLARLFGDLEPFANMATILNYESFSAPARAPSPSFGPASTSQLGTTSLQNSRRVVHLRHTPHQPPSEMTAADFFLTAQ